VIKLRLREVVIENNTNNNVKTGEQRHGRLRLQVPRIVESGTVRDDNDVYDSETVLYVLGFGDLRL